MHGVAIAAEKSYELNVKFSGEELVVSKLQSCIFRKLRSLGDVVVTTQKSDNTDYNVEIMVLESGFKGTVLASYSMATLVTSKTSVEEAKKLLVELFEVEKNQALLAYLLSHGKNILSFTLAAGPDIEASCEDVVVTIDTDVLEPDRQVKIKVKQLLQGGE